MLFINICLKCIMIFFFCLSHNHWRYFYSFHSSLIICMFFSSSNPRNCTCHCCRLIFSLIPFVLPSLEKLTKIKRIVRASSSELDWLHSLPPNANTYQNVCHQITIYCLNRNSKYIYYYSLRSELFWNSFLDTRNSMLTAHLSQAWIVSEET